MGSDEPLFPSWNEEIFVFTLITNKAERSHCIRENHMWAWLIAADLRFLHTVNQACIHQTIVIRAALWPHYIDVDVSVNMRALLQHAQHALSIQHAHMPEGFLGVRMSP